MHFNEHSALAGSHAFLSASKYHWLNYDDEKLVETWTRAMAAQKGTELHEFAAKAISLGVKLPRNTKTLNMYVNDAIGYRMTPEQPLVYSKNCFGTADAISFSKGLLRIHDLKTGVIPAHIEQLLIYSALFCLEYDEKPAHIRAELRLYQNDAVVVHEPEAGDILRVMDKIRHFDKLINEQEA